jgi:histidinol dehydrogenase
MRRIDWNALDEPARRAALARPARARRAEVEAGVRRIIEQVRADGDATLRALTRRFDEAELDRLDAGEAEFARAESALPPELKGAIGEARDRIVAFHRATAPQPVAIDTAPGVRCERILRPIRTVGLYVPAGSAPLPSTALMLGVPAQLAGCPGVVLCTPPRADGTADPAVLYAARLCGIARVFKVGGAQAIAAMAYGTASVPRCDKVFGPGNAWVTEAKRQVAADPDGAQIDLPAGPSEVMAVADAGADPRFVAADLLAQAEHGPDSQVLAVSDSGALLDAVAAELARQIGGLPRRGIASQALAGSRLVETRSIGQALEVANAYAPEHLILHLVDARRWLDRVESAGSVFLGPWSPESVGDYCSGTNHVLPTDGAARALSGLSVASFAKQITVQELTRAGLGAIGPCAIALARAERLDAHANAVAVRLASEAA